MRLRLYHARYTEQIDAGPLMASHAEGKFRAGHQTNTAMPRAVCHERTDARRCDAVQEMEVGPPEPAVRGRLQTTASCDGQEPWW
jgi:hypothetical protein